MRFVATVLCLAVMAVCCATGVEQVTGDAAAGRDADVTQAEVRVEPGTPVCAPGARSCDSPFSVVICNETGTAWEHAENCVPPFQCIYGCCPQCQDKQCGQDGCAGVCGECAAPAVCEAWQCVYGKCTNSSLKLEGGLNVFQQKVLFDHAEIELTHRLAPGFQSDGCITSIYVALKSAGCYLDVVTTGRIDPEGWMDATDLLVGLGPTCWPEGVTWSGEAHGEQAGAVARIFAGEGVVPGQGVKQSCWHSSVVVELRGTLEGEDGGKELSFDGSWIQVIGQMQSTGQEDVECPCHYSCLGKECGDDGCGQECAVCADGLECYENQCVEHCVLGCLDKVCGDDGCGGQCGQCKVGEECQDGQCIVACAPDCLGRHCGPDGCGGQCGQCPGFSWCQEDGTCANACQDACKTRECGPDGCGGNCGQCPWGHWCGEEGLCHTGCHPVCGPWECGSDNCGESYGQCDEGTFCVDNVCVGPEQCIPGCELRECGDNGCGATCGQCALDVECTNAGWCGSSCASCGFGPECYDYPFPMSGLSEWRYSFAEMVDDFEGIVSEDGSYMLKLRTGPAQDVDSSQASYQNCLPAGQYGVEMRWKLVSEEFKEWCDSYEDWVSLKVTQEDKAEELFYVDVSYFCGVYEACPWDCPWFGVELEQLGPPFEDAWMTPWLQASFILDVKDSDKSFTLEFFMSDDGGAGYPSFFLIDRLKLTRCDTACDVLQCGDSACGEHCGDCPSAYKCVQGHCCKPDCTDKLCGESCGEQCGECPEGQTCDDDGQCVAQCEGDCECVPDCHDKLCGDDGCGGKCGSCPGTKVCFKGGCCLPDCDSENCGDDDCGGSCGECTEPAICQMGECKCTPDCAGKGCGPDGCGGQCGECAESLLCVGGSCQCTQNSPPVVAEHWTFAVSPQDSLSKSDWANDIVTMPGGGAVIGGSWHPENSNFKPFLTRLTPDGDVVWQYGYGQEDPWQHFMRDAAVNPTGEILFAGRRMSSQANTHWQCRTVKVDPDGQLVWERVYDTTGGIDSAKQCDCFDIDTLPDGGLLLAGYMNSVPGDGMHNSWLMRADKSGEEVWSHVSDLQEGNWSGHDELGAVEVMSTGILASVANSGGSSGGATSVWLLTHDMDGGLLSTIELEPLPPQCRMAQMTRLPDDRLAMLFYCNLSYSQPEGLQMRVVDLEGQIVWRWQCHEDLDQGPRLLTLLPDEGLLVAGASSLDPQASQAWAMRLNLSGNLVWHRKFPPEIASVFRDAAVLSDGSVWLAGAVTTATDNNDTTIVKLGPTCLE